MVVSQPGSMEKIEETVSLACSSLYGRLPRSRVNLLAETLANLLEEETEELDSLIGRAARLVHLDEEEVLRLTSSSSPGQKMTDKLEYEPGRGFSTRSALRRWTAGDFCATRFGSTKLKTFRNEVSGKEEARLQHPYTQPSHFAFLQLLVHLNLVALGHKLHLQTFQ